ncbi:unnamed protein product, partial [Ixodes persulcatus]
LKKSKVLLVWHFHSLLLLVYSVTFRSKTITEDCDRAHKNKNKDHGNINKHKQTTVRHFTKNNSDTSMTNVLFDRTERDVWDDNQCLLKCMVLIEAICSELSSSYLKKHKVFFCNVRKKGNDKPT